MPDSGSPDQGGEPLPERVINMEVRDVRENDADRIAVLMGQLGYPQQSGEALDQIRTYSACAQRFVLVAEETGEGIGFVSFHATPLFHEPGYLGRITAMCVDETRRSSGVGRRLLAQLEERADEMGCLRIEVCSGDRRESEAHAFYESQGYQVDCRRFIKRRKA